MEDDPGLQLAAELDLFSPPLQSTLKDFYERALFAASNISTEGSLAGATDPEVDELGAVISLAVDHHAKPVLDAASRMRRGITLRFERLQESNFGPTGTYDIWWMDDPEVEGGVRYELRRRKDESKEADTAYSGGETSNEVTVQMLLDLLPSPNVATSEDKLHRLPATGIQSNTIAQRFGALGIFGS